MDKSLIFTLRKSLIKTTYRLSQFFSGEKNSVSAICYHSISDSKDKYAISYKTFRSQIEKILKTHSFISTHELIKVVSGKQLQVKPSVLLTIDDGYADVVRILPLVKKYQIPVVLFVMSDPKKANRKELDNEYPLLSWRQLKYLKSQGFTIGCHSATHANLQNLKAKDLAKEIMQSKKQLEEKLGFNVDYFAYPKGLYNQEIKKAVKVAGFKAAFSVDGGSINEASDKLALPRLVIDKSCDLGEIPAIFSRVWFLTRGLMDKFNLYERVIRHAK